MINVRSVLREIDCRCLHRDVVFMGDDKDTTFYRRLMGALRRVAKPLKIRVEDLAVYRKLAHRELFANSWCDSRFFVASVDYYRAAMMDFYREMNDFEFECIAEHRLCQKLRRHRGDRRYICRFVTQVRFDGYSGMPSDGPIHRQDSPQSIINIYQRQLCRIFFPFLWI